MTQLSTASHADAFDRLLAAFDRAFEDFSTTAPMRFLCSPGFGRAHYAAALREFYFYTRDNPQLQASMTLRFQGRQRDAVKRMLGHAIAEVGHDQLALNDLQALGIDPSSIPHEDPLPSTMPMLAYPYWLLASNHAVGYLGHVFFLEFLPTRAGRFYLDVLLRAGIPFEACSFLAEHSSVDEQHNRLMEQHVADLVHDEGGLRACEQAIKVSAHLYAGMLAGAFAAAEAKVGQSGTQQPRC